MTLPNQRTLFCFKSFLANSISFNSSTRASGQSPNVYNEYPIFAKLYAPNDTRVQRGIYLDKSGDVKFTTGIILSNELGMPKDTRYEG